MKSWLCKNCGHHHEATEELSELSFVWLDEHTSRISCANCKTYTLQRASAYDRFNRPTAGEFLAVKTYNRIRKGKKQNDKRRPIQ